MKTCTKCGVIKELAKFDKSNAKKDGFHSLCKDCRREYRETHKEQIKEKNREYREAHINQLKVNAKAYYKSHKEEICARSAKYRCDNAEELKQQRPIKGKKYREKHREALSAYAKQRRITHPEIYAARAKAYREANKDAIREKDKTYKREHKDALSVATEKRRTKRKRLESTLTKEQWAFIKESFGNKCAYCGKEKKLEQDHFVPLAKSGEYTHNNIVPACRQCNRSKHDKLFHDWYPRQAFYSKKREGKILRYLNYENGIQQLSLWLKQEEL